MSSPLPPPPSDRPSGGPTPSPGSPGPYPASGPVPAAAPWPSSAPPPAPPGTFPGYAPYGQQPAPTRYSGMAITGFVLALVGLLPCFWIVFQVPGVLGLIFSILGLKATANGARRGRGLAIAGLVVSAIAIVIAALFTLFVYTSDDCVTDGLQFDCEFSSD